jgi:CheY-like chemotaxis protein
VRLPIIAIANEQPTSSPGSVASGSSRLSDGIPSIAGIRVLVVDDDRESREVVAANLASRQAVVRTAASAAQAFELLQREEIDVLLADIGMPGEDGLTLIRRLRAVPSTRGSIPAAALTALARDEDRQQALDAGFQLHLAKPIDSISLIAAVASLGKLRAA